MLDFPPGPVNYRENAVLRPPGLSDEFGLGKLSSQGRVATQGEAPCPTQTLSGCSSALALLDPLSAKRDGQMLVAKRCHFWELVRSPYGNPWKWWSRLETPVVWSFVLYEAFTLYIIPSHCRPSCLVLFVCLRCP